MINATEPKSRKPTVRNREQVEFHPNLMTEQEAAEYIRMSAGTLRNWRSAEQFALPVTFVGTTPMYLRDRLDSWLESRTVTKASEFANLPK